MYKNSKYLRHFSNYRTNKIVSTEGIQYESSINIRTVKFNRPSVLNALNLEMIRSLVSKLRKYENNRNINAIIFKGSGDKAFCAGGDIKFLYQNALKNINKKIDQGVPELTSDFFREEYRLNYYLATIKKPIVSILNGITMGGGVGLSLHGLFKVATENTVIAMPETSIGFFPDVGTSYILPRIRSPLIYDKNGKENDNAAIGTFLALTGERIKGIDNYIYGLVDFYINKSRIDSLINDISGTNYSDQLSLETKNDMIREIIEIHEDEKIQETLEISENLRKIIDIFGNHHKNNTIEGILERLEKDRSLWSTKLKNNLLKMSPLSLKVTMESMKRGKKQNLQDCLKMEYRIARRMMYNPDFFEGVRSVIIDKDNKPKWKHTDIIKVTNEEVLQFFKPLPDDEELILYKQE